jgi:transcription antitermination factor NusG
VFWYALEVITRKEKLVAAMLAENGYECFLPLWDRRKIWSDRIKVASVPLFCGYVFCRFDVQFRLPILITPGVRGIVGHGKRPAAVSERELEAVRLLLRHRLPIEPCDGLQLGDPVRVTKGALTGIEGTYLRHGGSHRLVLSVSLIRRSVAVEIDELYVEPLGKRSGSEYNSPNAHSSERAV